MQSSRRRRRRINGTSMELDQKQGSATVHYLAAVTKNTDEVLDLVRAHPKDPGNVQALKFVIKTARGARGMNPIRRWRSSSATMCATRAWGMAAGGSSPSSMPRSPSRLLRAVLEQNPNRDDRGMACYMLAFYLRNQAEMVRRIREKPARIDNYVPERFKAATERFVKRTDPEALEKRMRSTARTGRSRSSPTSRTVFDQADARGDRREGELFAMRNLSVGKVAPEITGKDHEGKPFALSDYPRQGRGADLLRELVRSLRCDVSPGARAGRQS